MSRRAPHLAAPPTPRARRNSGKVSTRLLAPAEAREGRGRERWPHPSPARVAIGCRRSPSARPSARALRLGAGGVRQSRRRALPGAAAGRSCQRKSEACFSSRCPGDAGVGRPDAPGPEATAVTGAPVRSAIVREASDAARSASGPPRCGLLTFWGPERGSGARAGSGSVCVCVGRGRGGTWGPGAGGVGGGRAAEERQGGACRGPGAPPHRVLAPGKWEVGSSLFLRGCGSHGGRGLGCQQASISFSTPGF